MPAHQKHNPNRVRDAAQKRQRPKVTDRSPAAALAQQTDLLVLQRAVENPGAASPDAILALQGAAGNRAVSNLLVQAKLVVGPVGDRYEREADRVAEQAMAMPTPSAERGSRGAREQGRAAQTQPSRSGGRAAAWAATRRRGLYGTPPLQRQAEEEEELQMKPLANTITPLVQRQPEEEEELLQGKPETSAVQRQELEEEELQAKSEIRNPAGGFKASDDIKSRLTNLKGNGSPLPDALRADVEARFGADFSAVRIHADGEAGKLNRDLRARAFTHGSDIYFGAGRYDPDSSAGKRLLAHELTHVVQQTGGQVQHQTKNRSHGANSKYVTHTQPQAAQGAAVVQRVRIGASKEERDEEIAKHFGKETWWENMPERIKESYRQRYQEETAGTPPAWEERRRKERIKERQRELKELPGLRGMDLTAEGYGKKKPSLSSRLEGGFAKVKGGFAKLGPKAKKQWGKFKPKAKKQWGKFSGAFTSTLKEGWRGQSARAGRGIAGLFLPPGVTHTTIESRRRAQERLAKQRPPQVMPRRKLGPRPKEPTTPQEKGGSEEVKKQLSPSENMMGSMMMGGMMMNMMMMNMMMMGRGMSQARGGFNFPQLGGMPKEQLLGLPKPPSLQIEEIKDEDEE